MAALQADRHRRAGCAQEDHPGRAQADDTRRGDPARRGAQQPGRAARRATGRMTWVRIDDKLHAHPKILAAWKAEPASLGLHLLALSFSGAYLTDGLVGASFVEHVLPSTTRRRRATGALVEAG